MNPETSPGTGTGPVVPAQASPSQVPVAGVVPCLNCGAEVSIEIGVGWVDIRSRDDGGTYDICPATAPDARDRHHHPAKRS